MRYPVDPGPTIRGPGRRVKIPVVDEVWLQSTVAEFAKLPNNRVVGNPANPDDVHLKGGCLCCSRQVIRESFGSLGVP